ncbi:MAG: DNA sulfur modification protein DndB [Bacteroidales bacterium]|nr:DNA sulfur modification protein DndB [Bacteroidales bacterium]
MNNDINIPAIRGKIGNTIYYSANFTFQQINDLVKKVEGEIYTSAPLKERIQRSLTDNSGKIKQYILDRNDRFFNALVLAVYDGEPQWTEIRFELEDNIFPNVGILHLNGREKIFPVDGQHRVEGIKDALKKNPTLANEMVSVMLIGHNTSSEGMKKSRRIFSTLNRYAKPVKLGDIIALDEDDIVAIATRELLENHPLFSGERMKVSNSKSIATTDKSSFTSLITLYECNTELFQWYHFKRTVSGSKLKDFLKTRPDEELISSFCEYLDNFWKLFIQIFPEVKDFLDAEPQIAANKYRDNNNGGNIIFRPVTLLQMIKAIVYILTEDNTATIEGILNRYCQIDRNVSSLLWDKIIWNSTSKTMLVNNQILLKYLFVYIYDSTILKNKHLEDFYQRYELVKNINRDDIKSHLLRYL